VADLGMRQGQKPNALVAWGLDSDLFHNRLMDALKNLANSIK
ncbi:MAG: hypothetical protein RL355_967, partial [Actinomycetota bacterium]